MFEGKIYKVMIGCPSDIQKEVETAKTVINDWNSEYSELHKVFLFPKHWSTDAYPDWGKHPQKHINEQIVAQSDLLVCIFGAKIGSPTDTSISGTVEEIEEHIKAGKHVMVFFRKKNESQGWEQQKAIEEFKKDKKNEGLWWYYDDESSFEDIFRNKLALFLSNNWLKDNIVKINEDNINKLKDAIERRLQLEKLMTNYQQKISTANYKNTKEMILDVTADLMARIHNVVYSSSHLFIHHGNEIQQFKEKLEKITSTLSMDQIDQTTVQNVTTEIITLYSSIRELINEEIKDTYSD